MTNGLLGTRHPISWLKSAALALGVSGVGLGEAEAHDELRRDMTLRFETVKPAPKDPHWNWFVPGADFYRGALQGVLEPLFFVNAETGALSGFLAETSAYDPATLTYTINLRRDVKWSDRRQFDAEDIRFSIQLVLDDPALIGPHVEAVRQAVASVSADFARPFEVSIVLLEEDPLFLRRHFAASDGESFPIVPAHIWSEVGDIQTYRPETPIGTGPYRLDRRPFEPLDADIVRWTRYSWWADSSTPEVPHWLEWHPPREAEARPAEVALGGIDVFANVNSGVARGVGVAVPYTMLMRMDAQLPGAMCGFDLYFTGEDGYITDTPAFRDAMFTLVDRGWLSRRADLPAARPAQSFAIDVPGTAEFRAMLSKLDGLASETPDLLSARASLAGLQCGVEALEPTCTGETSGEISKAACKASRLTCNLNDPNIGNWRPLPPFAITTAADDAEAAQIGDELGRNLARYGVMTTRVESSAVNEDLLAAGDVGFVIHRRACPGLDQPAATLRHFLDAPRPVEGEVRARLCAAIRSVARDPMSATGCNSSEETAWDDTTLTEAAMAYLAAQVGFSSVPLIYTAQLYPASTLYWTGWPEGPGLHPHWSQRTQLWIRSLIPAD